MTNNFGRSGSTSNIHESSDKYNVLIVDDIPTNLAVIEGLLTGYDINLIRAMDGKKAVDLYKTRTIDLVFMDIQMPLMDGFDATREIRLFEKLQNMSKRPIIATTAHIEPADQYLCINAGMNDYLRKPLMVDELENVLQIWAPNLMKRIAA